MATASSQQLHIHTLQAVLAACPEAFAAVDTRLRVIEWNAAAEELTGFTRDQALGNPLPHLTEAQLEDLTAVLPSFEDWAEEVPLVLPRRHADGRIIQVCVTGYLRLVDAEGRPFGFGSFFRAVRATDPRTHLRNVYTRALAESVRTEDVREAMSLAIRDLLPGEVGHLLTRSEHGWSAVLSIGVADDQARAMEVRHPEQLDEVVREGTDATIELVTGGRVQRALVVPAGPQREQTVLALVAAPLEPPGAEAMEMARAVAAEAWAALARVRAVSELEDKLEILEAIAGIARATSLPHELMVEHVARHAAVSLSCERAAVYLWDEEGAELRLEAFHSADRAWEPSEEIHNAGRRVAARFSTSEPFLTQDTGACPWLAGPWDTDEGAVSVYGIPLAVGDRALGFLVVAHTTDNPRGFTSLCTQVGTEMARQASLAISNTTLMEGQARANAQLHEVNRRRADYVEGITHDLRTPVTAILGFAKTLLRARDRMSEADSDEALATIERQALRITRMLNDMMDTARADAGELHPDRQSEVPLHHVVSEALLVAPPESRNRLSAICDPDVTVYGDADQLTRVVQNLISNALKYAPEASGVEVIVERSAQVAVLVVVDHGPGIPAGLDVFGRFSRGDARGTGLGLYTVKKMVEAHGGTIGHSETPGGGTTVSVHLPLHAGG